MVAIIDPKEGLRNTEANVARALVLPDSKRGELRLLGGQYKSMHINLKRYPLDIDEIDPATLASRERRLWYNGNGKGYILGVQAALQVMAGDLAVEMFKAWAEPAGDE